MKWGGKDTDNNVQILNSSIFEVVNSNIKSAKEKNPARIHISNENEWNTSSLKHL